MVESKKRGRARRAPAGPGPTLMDLRNQAAYGKDDVERAWRRAFKGIHYLGYTRDPETGGLRPGKGGMMATASNQPRDPKPGRRRAGRRPGASTHPSVCVHCGRELRVRRGTLRCPVHEGGWFA